MRQVLYRIPWDGIPIGDFRLPIFGWGLLLLIWIGFAVWSAVDARRQTGHWQLPDIYSLVFLVAGAVGLIEAPVFGPSLAPEGVPIFGYGLMLLIGFGSAIWLSISRARHEGFPPETIWDLAVWLFFGGILGARTFYLIEYGHQVFAKAHTLPEILFAAVNLSEGGIVLYGSMIGGAAAFFAFCHIRKLPPLTLVDVITPSIFLGVGFGRIGCLLNGCCYGDYCNLPWCITFPAGSVPFESLVFRGFLSPDAPYSPPLHPTQIYSAIDGFLIAGLTVWYTRYRRRPGDVFALALLICPVTRFLLEFVRGDESGVWGTPFTISQVVSVALFAVGVGLQVYLSFGTALSRPVRTPAAG